MQILVIVGYLEDKLVVKRKAMKERNFLTLTLKGTYTTTNKFTYHLYRFNYMSEETCS